MARIAGGRAGADRMRPREQFDGMAMHEILEPGLDPSCAVTEAASAAWTASPRPAQGPFGAWRDALSALREVVDFTDAIIGPDVEADHAATRPDSLEARRQAMLPAGWRVPLEDVPGTAVPAVPGGAPHILDLVAEGGGGIVRVPLLREPENPFSVADATLVSRLAPVLRLLVRCCGGAALPAVPPRLDVSVTESLLAVFDQLGLGLCLVDAELRPILVSGRALRSGVLRRRQDRLGTAERGTDARLRAAVADVLAVRDGPVQGLNLGGGARPSRVLVTALGGKAGAPPARIAALILLPDGPPRHIERVIQSMFGLTPVEARIAKLLGDGMTPNEAALAMRMRPATLRSYLKSVFVKLDVHRQSELVRLVCTTAGMLRGTASAMASATEPAAVA